MTTKPKLPIVEVNARSIIDQLLMVQPPSEAITSIKTRRGKQLEADAENLERRVREVDRVRDTCNLVRETPAS